VRLPPAAVLPTEAMLVDLSPRDKIGEAMGFILACGMVGRNIGPLFGGTIQWLSISYGLSEQNSFRIPYFVDAGLAAVSALLIMFGIKESKVEFTNEAEDIKNKKHFKIPGQFKVLLICAFITGVGEGFIRPILALFYSDVFGAEPIEIGLLMSLSGFIAIFAGFISGRASDKFGRKLL